MIRLFAAGGFSAWIFSGVVVVILVERGDRNNWDIALERSAAIVLRLAGDEYRETGKLGRLRGEMPLRFPGQMIQFRDAAGHLLLRTDDAPNVPFVESGTGFGDIRSPDGDWRVGSFRDKDSGLTLQIADSQSLRRHEFLQLGLALLMPLIVGLPIVVIGAWLLAARALQPLHHTAHQLERRQKSDLSPIGLNGLPQEAIPLVKSFNHLLFQLAESWEDERRFAASVAHELRTPLAGIRLNLQSLHRKATAENLKSSLFSLLGAVDQTTRVIEQLMTLARLERNNSRDVNCEPLELRRIIDETLNEFTERARERGLRFEVSAQIDAVQVPAQALYLVMRNLIESAMRRSPRDGLILISAKCDQDFWWLQVDDGDG